MLNSHKTQLQIPNKVKTQFNKVDVNSRFPIKFINYPTHVTILTQKKKNDVLHNCMYA